MLKFLVRLAGFCALQLPIALAVIWFGSEKSGRSTDDDSYLLAMKDKMGLLQSDGHRRIIFVGGSNVAFGIHSPLFAEALHRQPVNLGLHGALGLGFPLRCAQDGVREGDIVVVMPEYHLLVARPHADAAHATEMVSLWPQARRYLETTDDRIDSIGLKPFLDQEGLQLIHEHVQRARRNLSRPNRHISASRLAAGGASPGRGKLARQRRAPAVPRHEPIYRRSAFNQYGDMVAHHGLPGKPLTGSTRVAPLSPQNRECLDCAIRMLNDFNSVCRAKGAKVYFSYAPIPDTMFDRSKEGLDEIHRRLERSLEIPIVTRPEQTCFAAELFYDTVNHLGQEGAKARSEVMAQAITRYIDPAEGPVLISRRDDSVRR